MSLFYHFVNTEYGAIHSHLALPDSIFQMTNLYLEHANKPIERHELIQLRNNLLKIGAKAADHKTVFTRLFSTRSAVTQNVYDQFKEVYQDMLQRNLEQIAARN